MIRILIADDEEKLRKAIIKYAQFYGYETLEALDGQEAVAICEQQPIDLVLLDVMMPRMDGITACRQIRKFSDTPIIMLTAKNEEYDRIIGFESGADDYVDKPFSPKELMLRIEAVLKRSQKTPPLSRTQLHEKGALKLSAGGQWLEVNGQRKELALKELELMSYFFTHEGQIISREELCQAIWRMDKASASRTLDTHVKQLRKLMGPYSEYITTVYGRGYRFEVT